MPVYNPKNKQYLVLLLIEAALHMMPETPSNTRNPVQGYFTYKKWGIERSVIISDKESYIRNFEMKAEGRLRKFYGASPKWLYRVRYPDKRPSKEHYLLSPEMLDIMRESKEKQKEYWSAVSNFLVGELSLGEKTLAILAGDLSKARDKYLAHNNAEGLFKGLATTN